jgi:hypothetical protein
MDGDGGELKGPVLIVLDALEFTMCTFAPATTLRLRAGLVPISANLRGGLSGFPIHPELRGSVNAGRLGRSNMRWRGPTSEWPTIRPEPRGATSMHRGRNTSKWVDGPTRGKMPPN